MLAAAGVAADDAETTALQRLLDRAEIEELVVRYVHALDTLDADAYEGVFTADAVYELPGGVVHNGRAAIRKIVTDLQAARARNEAAGTPSPRLYHVMANSSIEILDATNARHRSYAQTVRAADNGQFVVGFMGRYEDVLAVTAKAFDALVLLAEHAGELVPRSALVEALWPHTVAPVGSINTNQ
jgi:uncharacterized protein (TIGR02246 family)